MSSYSDPYHSPEYESFVAEMVNLQQYWLQRLPIGEKAMLGILIKAYPEAVYREQLTEATNYQRSSRDAYLQRLAAKELVTDAGRGQVKASDNLF